VDWAGQGRRSVLYAASFLRPGEAEFQLLMRPKKKNFIKGEREK
jgi:hypothetical protein